MSNEGQAYGEDRGPAPEPQEIIKLLHRVRQGEEQASSELMRAIEAELHRIAAWHMRKERPDHTLQTTALVNEAYLRLLGSEPIEWNDRSHFLAMASRAMRQILIDYARARSSQKRGGGRKVDLESAGLSLDPVDDTVLDVDAALQELAAIAPRQAQLVELRFFGGLSLERVGEVLGLSERTVDKDWALARAWLRRRLGSA